MVPAMRVPAAAGEGRLAVLARRIREAAAVQLQHGCEWQRAGRRTRHLLAAALSSSAVARSSPTVA